MSKKYSPELAKKTKNSILIARSAPLPFPSELKEYEKILPGITDRMMSSYEKQQAHRMELEKMVVRSDVSKTDFGSNLCVHIKYNCSFRRYTPNLQRIEYCRVFHFGCKYSDIDRCVFIRKTTKQNRKGK